MLCLWYERNAKKNSMPKHADPVTGIVYTKNLQRSLISNGPDGPLGDMLVVSGLVYKNPALSGSPVGTFDFTAVTTSVGEIDERRQVFVEVSFSKKYARRSWISNLEPAIKTPGQRAEVSLSGVETFPLGGGLPNRLNAYGVTTGTGQFLGAEGVVNISYDPVNQAFAYEFSLV
jgi:hypothetical protein